MSNRVLFVDDDANVLAAHRRTFRGVFEFTTAANAVEAMRRILDGERYAVVVSDFTMPGVNGLQLLRELTHRAPDTVCVMLSGNADITDALAAVQRGDLFRFLTKPCPADRLTAVIREALAAHRTRRPRGSTLPPDTRAVALADIHPEDVLVGDITTTSGSVLLRRGTLMTPDLLDRVRSHAATAPAEEPILVRRALSA
ncbi:MAG: response regulator [Caenispirillum sp.]|nr:response regulator [Caenispirillum sp.]